MNYAANIPDFVKWGIFANYATQRPNFAAAAHDRSWPGRALPPRPRSVRYRRQSGHVANIGNPPLLTRSRHEDSTPLLHLDNDLPLGSTLLKICKSLLRLIERKYLVDHRPNAPRLEKFTDLRELVTVRSYE